MFYLIDLGPNSLLIILIAKVNFMSLILIPNKSSKILGEK